MVNSSFDLAANISRFAVAFLPMLVGIVLHELAHGYAAYRLGDPTAKMEGRLTLNPLAHLDVTGGLFFVVTALFSPFIFGWAKPIPVQAGYFKNPRQGMIIVSAVAPFTNFLLAFVFGGLYFICLQWMSGTTLSSTDIFLLRTLNMGIIINFVLGWFNLLPLPGLDGGHILAGFLPYEAARKFYELSRYGFLLLILLLATNLLRYIMGPLLGFSMGLVGDLFSIPPRLLYLYI